MNENYMSMQIQFNYHDSYIDCIEILDDNTIRLRVVLYSVYYHDTNSVSITFAGIFNEEKTKQYFKAILRNADSPTDIGCGIQRLDYDSKKESVQNNLYLHLITNWEDKITIHCKSFFEKIEK